jgi:chemotaxis methyl-accepting protein methylase
MSLRPEQVEAFFKAVNERTPPAPLSRPLTMEQVQYVDDQLPKAFEAIGMHTVSDAAFKAALASDKHLYSLRERALYVQPAELLSRKLFRFRGRMPTLHTALVRLLTDAAGAGQRKLRFWNPCCGAGADTYSLAAMSRLALNATGTNSSIEVIGSDLLPAALRYAETGRYEFRRSEWRDYIEKHKQLFGDESITEDAQLPISTKHLPPGVELFFSTTRLEEAGYVIAPGETLRQMTRFRPVNLLRFPEVGQLGTFDAVMTFSPAIVSDTPAARPLRNAVAFAVRAGGYLVLPETPTAPPDLLAGDHGFQMVEPGLFYRTR